MALATNNTGDFTTVRSPYNLQTQQKRVRHLRSISVRNLHSGAQGNRPLSRLQCYFTLHTHIDAQAFYESEKITGSTNPSWQSFDISQYEDQINLASKFMVLRVWVGQQDSFQLLIVMEVHLSGLHFLTDKLQQLVVKTSPNMVIFGMLDKEFIFINREHNRLKNLAKRISDMDLPSSALPAVVKVEQSVVRNSYTTSALCRIQTVLRAIKQMQTHARRYRRQIEDRLLASQENSKKLEDSENLHMSVSQLRQELLRRTTVLIQSQERLRVLKEANTTREESLRSETELLSSQLQALQEDNRDHIVKREQLVKENALLNLRRRQMLSELFSFIYPITHSGNKYYINGVRLPHAEELQGQDEIMVAVGLGYACHLTLKTAQILGLPLRHPMENRGSKSVIFDQVHSKLADKDREFPLYSKGKDKNHFNYGVFLLNKNISQLRYQCSMPTLDLRQTLENLLTVMHKLGVKMEGDPSMAGTLTASTPECITAMLSPNGSSSTGLNFVPPLMSPSANGDVMNPPATSTTITTSTRSHEAKPHQHHYHHHGDKSSSDFIEGSMATGSSNVVSGGMQGGEPKNLFNEGEDLFKPSGDDHFFSVGGSFLEEFSSSSPVGSEGVVGGENHRLTDLSPGREDGEESERLRISRILQTASEGVLLTPSSFKLLKGKERSGRRLSEGSGEEWDGNNSGENGVDADIEDLDRKIRIGIGGNCELLHPDKSRQGCEKESVTAHEDEGVCSSSRAVAEDSEMGACAQAVSGLSDLKAEGLLGEEPFVEDELLQTEDG